jgi:hypothetical protein
MGSLPKGQMPTLLLEPFNGTGATGYNKRKKKRYTKQLEFVNATDERLNGSLTSLMKDYTVLEFVNVTDAISYLHHMSRNALHSYVTITTASNIKRTNLTGRSLMLVSFT